MTLHVVGRLFVIGVCATLARGLAAQEVAPAPAISVSQDVDGRLAYTGDGKGNSIIDFSHAGFGGGGQDIPAVPARILVEPQGHRDGDRIQAALDLVAALPLGPDGFRGAVLLRAGRYSIDGGLRIGASGVVLRGSGEDENGTVLVAAGQSRRTLIEVAGRGDLCEVTGSRRNVADAYVPVGATRLRLDDASGLAVGMRIVIRRPSTAEWIACIGMNEFSGWRPENRIQWGPGSRDIEWERSVLGVEDNIVVLDAPITTAIDRAEGGGTVAPCNFVGRIDHVGVENLRCVSEFVPNVPQDEEHAWGCISLDKVEDGWVRQVTALHFVGYVINTHAETRSLTIEDCVALEPISEIAAYRRRVFSIGGQLTLVQRCRSEHGLHDFTTGFTAAGPNVFLECTAQDALSWSGPLESWASGVLYDNVIIRGNALRFLDRGADGQGAGWTAANSMLWNCESTEIQVQSPPGALNQEYGCKGLVVDDSLVYDPRFRPYTDPRFMPYREFFHGYATRPRSLYLAQLAERKGAAALGRLSRVSVSTSGDGAHTLTAADLPAQAGSPGVHPLRIERAQFTIDGRRAWTGTTEWSWYLGQMPRRLAVASGPAITRFAPGENGPGLTDNLEEVVATMPPGSVFVQHYGLWYDRRRINHDFYGAPELPASDVSAPFMEMPWARSGQGTDWDGMSKYDLTRFNPWYFRRVRDFAKLCDANGRILFYNFYLQHALQETRAHYVDFPWRPVNCLQATDMPDENPAGSVFYDVSHPIRRDLHRRYIRHCLDVLKGDPNVVYGLDREYSGPLSFVQFWLETIAEWEKENGQTVYLALEAPKAEMDALLTDPVYRPVISAIGLRDWFYRADGSLYAIVGGINKAPREQWAAMVPEADLQGLRESVSDERYRGAGFVNSPGYQSLVQKIRASSAAMRYRAWREYRDEFPELVLLNQNDEYPELTAAIDRNIPAAARALTRPAAIVRGQPETSWAMAAEGKAYLVYTMAGQTVRLDLSRERGAFRLAWLDSASGEFATERPLVHGGGDIPIQPPVGATPRPWVAWLTPSPES